MFGGKRIKRLKNGKGKNGAPSIAQQAKKCRGSVAGMVIRRRSFMARRDESLLNLLAECPWWVSVLVSGIAFVFLRFILPVIDFHGMAANAFAKSLSRNVDLWDVDEK